MAGAPELRSLVWKGFALFSGWVGCVQSPCGHRLESVRHWMEGYRDLDMGGGLAVSSLTRPPFWRLSLGLHILRGAEEGNLRAVGQVLKGPCGLFWLRSLAAVLLGFPLWGRNVALLPVGFLAFLCVCVDTVSSTRAAEIKWQLPHPGAPQ